MAKPSQYDADAAAPTANDLLVAALSKIPGLGGTPIAGDEVEFHDGNKISLPRGTTFEAAGKILERLREEAEVPTTFTRVFRYRADDGAYAAFQVIKDRYGMLLGKQTATFFGMMPAETKTIAIGVNQTMQLPWGRIEIPIFKGLEIVLHEHRDSDYGRIFAIHAEGPRKYKDEMEAFFDNVAEYLKTNSIYRGHALIGAEKLEFLDVDGFDPSKIVFSDDVLAMLEGNLWASIRHTDTMRREGISLKRAMLLYGPYGTGKTSTGLLTAREAVQNGWTFISAKPGRDKIEDVLRTAKLYQPAVVFVEDIDGEASSGENQDVTRLLEAFDGISGKGGELMILMTTNHIDRIHKGMLRPGRLDAVVEVAALDRNGIEKLIKAIVQPGKLAADVNYDEVAEAMTDFLPAFIRETITRAVSFSIARNGGSSEYVIDTPDLCNAAHSLRPQLDHLDKAGEGNKRPSVDGAIEKVVKGAVAQFALDARGGERLREYDSETGEFVAAE